MRQGWNRRAEQRGVRTARQQRIVELVAAGMSNAEIARELGATQCAVKSEICGIYDRLGLWNRVELALWHIARTEGVA